MSVSGISSQTFIPYNTQQAQSQRTQMQQEFQQLGQDLQSGNLSASQSDMTALQQFGQGISSNPTQSSNSISQEFSQLAQDLKSGNLSSAQTDYSKLQQNLQSRTEAHHSHHRHFAGGSGNDLNQLFQQLGQELQSGNLSTAQQTYAALQQDFGFSQTASLASAQSTNAVSAIA